jgi:hypothetical protein
MEATQGRREAVEEREQELGEFVRGLHEREDEATSILQRVRLAQEEFRQWEVALVQKERELDRR